MFFLFQTVGDFAHFEQLRWEDQEKIRQRIEAGPGPGKKNGWLGSEMDDQVGSAPACYGSALGSNQDISQKKKKWAT